MRNVLWSLVLGLGIGACTADVGNEVPAKEDVPPVGAADGPDPCELYGWYGDGECDDGLGICHLPDTTDCNGANDCSSILEDIEECASRGVDLDRCAGVGPVGEADDTAQVIQCCSQGEYALNSVCSTVFPGAFTANAASCAPVIEAAEESCPSALDAGACFAEPGEDPTETTPALHACCGLGEYALNDLCEAAFSASFTASATTCVPVFEDAESCVETSTSEGLDARTCYAEAGQTVQEAAPALAACCDTEGAPTALCGAFFDE